MKTILVDVDGVLLKWINAFHRHMTTLGHESIENHREVYFLEDRYSMTTEEIILIIEAFNSSEAMLDLPPFKDSLKYIRKLKDDGFDFIATTSMGTDKSSHAYRRENLNNVFGEDAFSEVHCLPLMKSKLPVLSRWKNSNAFWIEDSVTNAKEGAQIGLRSILIEAPYNTLDGEVQGVTVVSQTNPWKEIYHIITNAYCINNDPLLYGEEQ